VDVAWVAQAFGIYREAVAAGVKPSMHMLNRMLMCLRVAWEGKPVSFLLLLMLLLRMLLLHVAVASLVLCWCAVADLTGC
jgi:hypothetical protein